MMSNHQKDDDEENQKLPNITQDATTSSYLNTLKEERKRKDEIRGERCRCWFCFLIGTAFLTAGSVFVPMGLRDEKKALALDPEEDFYLLDQPCSIESVVHVESEQKRCSRELASGTKSYYDCGCKDVYYYTFDAVQLLGEEEYDYLGYGYRSDSLTVNRGVSTCKGSARKLPPWEQGEQVQCWRPSQPGVAPPTQYQCANTDCIKVLDPRQDRDEAQWVARAMWCGGILSLALSSVCLFCFAIPRCWKSMKMKKEQEAQ